MIYVVQFSLDCNFACSYCFEHKSRKIKGARRFKITEDKLDSIENAIKKINIEKRIQYFEIIFFGGEPLLPANDKELKKLIEVSEKLEVDSITVITNGFYLDEFIGLFSKEKTKFQISVDGPANIHDKRRFGKYLKKSFHKIMKNFFLP